MESTLNTKIDVMRQEMVNAHSKMVSKEELSAHLKAIYKDSERIESQLREEVKDTREHLQNQLKEYREGSRKDLDSFKHDMNVSMTRLIAILGVVLTLVQIAISFL